MCLLTEITKDTVEVWLNEEKEQFVRNPPLGLFLYRLLIYALLLYSTCVGLLQAQTTENNSDWQSDFFAALESFQQIRH